jgi:hypothetical protein
MRACDRHLSDTYQQHEHMLTHALAWYLGKDVRNLRAFVREALGTDDVPDRLRLVEQDLPGQGGDAGRPEEEAIRRGLPDISVFDDDGSWALLIEGHVGGKGTAPPSCDQLARHAVEVKRQGFDTVRLLVIAPERPASALPGCASFMMWTAVYAWAARGGIASDDLFRLSVFIDVMESALYLGTPEDVTLTDIGRGRHRIEAGTPPPPHAECARALEAAASLRPALSSELVAVLRKLLFAGRGESPYEPSMKDMEHAVRVCPLCDRSAHCWYPSGLMFRAMRERFGDEA